MFIRKSKGDKDNQHTYYKLIESYRDTTGKVKHRTIKSLGREDMLLAKVPVLQTFMRKSEEPKGLAQIMAGCNLIARYFRYSQGNNYARDE